MMKMTVGFRVNADARIGGGHVMRCLTLAREIVRRGGECAFLVNAEAAATAPALARSGLQILQAPENAAGACAMVREALPSPFDWMVFDVYALGAAYERPFRDVARRIAVIDDLTDRPHDCDLLIDTTLGRAASDYNGLVAPATEILAGPGFAMLRPDFAAARAHSLGRRAMAVGLRTIFVSLGLTDVGGITAKIVSALAQQPGEVRFDVVLGPNAISEAEVRVRAQIDPRVTLHIDPRDIVSLMASADLAIGAAGTTSWERCCLGLPTVLVVLADNQRLMAQRLAAAAAVVAADAAAPEAIAAIAARLICSTDELTRMSLAARGVCDGLGASRVADCMERLAR